MWRKLGVTLIALLSTFSVVYAMNRDMFAAGTTYNAGGDVTGRVNMAPSNLVTSGSTMPSNIGLQKGDKVITDIIKPGATTPLGFQLIKYDKGYTDYTSDLGATTVEMKAPLNGWLSFTNEVIAKDILAVTNYTTASGDIGSADSYGNKYWGVSYLNYSNDLKTNLINLKTAFQQSILVHDRNLADIRVNDSIHILSAKGAINATPNNLKGKSPVLLTFSELAKIKTKDLSFSDKYWSGSSYWAALTSSAALQTFNPVYLNSDGTTNTDGRDSCGVKECGATGVPKTTNNLRPGAYLNMEDVVFAISKPVNSNTNIANVSEPELSIGYTSIYDETKDDSEMKLRLLDSSMSATFTDIKTNNKSITEIMANSKIDLIVDANIGTNHTVSVLVFDGITNELLFYKPLELAKGSGSYEFDTTGIPVGKYKLGIVNEIYDESSTIPTNSSNITAVKDFEIVGPLSLTFSPTPLSGATVANTYEYSKNVNAGDKIGELSFINGALPISLSVVSNPNAPSANVNDFKNFVLSTSSTSTSPVNIKVSGSGGPSVDATTSSLKAGDYYFRIEGVDANGLPSPAAYVDVKITVVKTDPQLAFTNNSASNTQTNMVYGSTITEPISTANKDTNYAISYSVNNSIVTASTEANTQNATVVSNTNNTTGISTITASIGETANYKAGTATRNINVYDAITSFTFTSVANISASDTTNPGYKVGTVDVIGGASVYKYSIATDPNGTPGANANASSFQVSTTSTNATTMDVMTAAQLPAGTYKVTFKIEDNYAQVKYVEATIVVNAVGQAAFDFFDYQNQSNIMTNQTIQIPYGTSNAKLLARGGSGSGAITYAVASADVSKGVISVNTTGDITIQKIGIVEVEATKAGSGMFQSVTIKMKVEIIPAYQTIAFNTVADTRHKLTGTPTFPELATATLVGGGNPVGGIRYSSSDPSIVTIDNAGTVTVVGKGTATITAIINENVSGNTNYNANYEQSSTTKKVTIFAGTSLVYNANSPNLQANEDAPATSTGTAVANANVGSVSIVPGTGSGNASYSISTSNDPANADASLFKINSNGILQLTQAISANDIRTHIGGNTYKVRVDFNDGNGAEIIDVVVTIEDAKQDLYFTDMNANKLNSISEVYKSSPNNTFQLFTHRYGSGTVTYALKQGTSTGVVSVNSAGLVSILKATDQTTPEVVQVEATVAAADGYQSKTTYINLVITPAPQTISFKDTTTLARTFVSGSTFLDDAELKEGSTVSSRTITYATSTPSKCSINASGTISMITIGDCKVTATNSDSNYISASTSKTINFYTGMGASYNQPVTTPQAETPSGISGRPMGNITVNGGQSGPKSFGIVSAGDPVKNADKAYFTVDSSGNLSLSKDVNASDLVGKYNSVTGIYNLKVQVEVSDSLNNKVIVDAVIEFKGAPLLAEFDRVVNGKISEVYSPAGKFNLNVINNAGGGVPNYRIKNDSNQPQDVLQSIVGSTVTILHANDKSPTGNSLPVMVEAVIPASNGYEAKTVEVEVEITKAQQSNFKFKTPTFSMQTSTDFTPVFVGIESKQTDGVTAQVPVMNSTNTNVINVTGGTTLSTNTNEGSNIQINALVKGDRDYKDGIASASVSVSSQPAYKLDITVPSATYGDTGVKATIFFNGASGGNQVQTWTSLDPKVATIDNSGNLTILKAGTTTIECRQTSDGEPTVTSSAIFVVNPKSITVNLDDKSKLVGEVMPAFTYQPITGLVGNDVLTAPTFTCLDTDGSPVISSTPSGVYAIQGSYATGTYPNYTITVDPGDLTITQDTAMSSWYNVVGTIKNGWYNTDVKVELLQGFGSSYDEIGNVIGTWSPSDFMVSNEGENITDIYFHNSTSGAYTSPATEKIKIDKTNPIIKSITGKQTNKNAISELINNLTFGVFFKPGTKVEIVGEDIIASGVNQVSGLSSIEYEVYSIDASGAIGTTPIVLSTSLTPDSSGKVDFTLSDVGMYRVCALTKDNAGNISSESCSDLNVKKIDVDVDGDGDLDFNDPNKDGCPDLNIVLKDKKGDYYKLNVDRDDDDIPDMNIDSNGKTAGSSPDGIADINVDADNDGKPDLNLVILSKWEPTNCVTDQSETYCTMKDIKAVINVDVDNDGIPDINIDTDGDMIADINIDTNNNGKLDPADSNITSKLEAWKPKTIHDKDSFIYGTMDSLKAYVNVIVKGDTHPSLNIDTDGDGLPNLNVDSDGDGIPETNIDGNGDGEADINIDVGNNGTPDENIMTITSWKPEKVVNGKITYQTMELEYKEKSELEDNGIVIRPKDPSETFLPNYALKVKDVTSSISDEDKESISNITGKDSEVKLVYDVNLLKDGQVTQPDGSIEVRIPIDTSIKNPKILMQNEDGSWKLMDAKIDGDYFVFETDYIGTVSVVGDKVSDTDSPTNQNPSLNPPTVKGDYTGGVGGAGTGDSTDTAIYFIAILISLSALSIVGYKKLNKL